MRRADGHPAARPQGDGNIGGLLFLVERGVAAGTAAPLGGMIPAGLCGGLVTFAGAAVDVAVDVGVPVGVGVELGVEVGDGVTVGVGVGVELGVGVGVGSALRRGAAGKQLGDADGVGRVRPGPALDVLDVPGNWLTARELTEPPEEGDPGCASGRFSAPEGEIAPGTWASA